MAAKVEVTKGNGTFGNIVSWGYDDSATPSVVEDGGGSVGEIQLNVRRTPGSKFLDRNEMKLTVPNFGSVTGTIDSVGPGRSQHSVSAAGILGKLAIDVKAPPVYGGQTLSDAYNAYLALGFKVMPEVQYIATKNPVVIYPGWEGNLWKYLKDLGAVTGTEMVVREGVIVIRNQGGLMMNLKNVRDLALSVNSQDMGQYVNVTVQNPTEVATVGGAAYNLIKNPHLGANATGWSYNLVGTGTPLNVAIGRVASLWDFYGSNLGYRLYQTNLTAMSNTAVLRTLTYTEDISDLDKTIPYYFSARIHFKRGTATTLSSKGVTAKVRWLDAAGEYVGESPVGNAFNGPGTGWYYKFSKINLTVPADATKAAFDFSISPTGMSGSNPPAEVGDELVVSGLYLSTTVGEYFDGALGGGTGWVGVANNSRSYKTFGTSVSFYDAHADDDQIYTVESGKVNSFSVDLGNFPDFLAQPEYTENFPVQVGQYLVSGTDGQPIPAKQWRDYGGALSVSINADNPQQMDVVFTAPVADIPSAPGPYSLSISAGQSSEFATFNVAGTGVKTSPSVLHYYTGAPLDATQNEVAAETTCPFIQTMGLGYTVASRLAGRHGGSQVTLTFSIALDQGTIANDIVGRIVPYDNSLYRITSMSADATGIECQAETFVKGSDFDAIWSASGTPEFNAAWSVKPYNGSDFQVVPLSH